MIEVVDERSRLLRSIRDVGSAGCGMKDCRRSVKFDDAWIGVGAAGLKLSLILMGPIFRLVSGCRGRHTEACH